MSEQIPKAPGVTSDDQAVHARPLNRLSVRRVDSAYLFAGASTLTINSVNEHLGVTADLQYMQSKYQNARDVYGFILGLRLAAEF